MTFNCTFILNPKPKNVGVPTNYVSLPICKEIFLLI
ncbi:hypothetical protein LEP1GSC005_0098, partial [Leptospira santarosai str. ST188]